MRKIKNEESIIKAKPCNNSALTFDDELEKSIHDFNKLVESNNKSFKEMTKLEKRVALAEDVLKQMSLKKYKIVAGLYIDFRDEEEKSCKVNVENFQKDSVVCECCAIGSLFLSNIAMGGGKKVTDRIEPMMASLSSIFSDKELRLLEYFFEEDDLDCLFDVDKDAAFDEFDNDAISDAVYSFNNKYSFHPIETDAKLTAIMENIIENNGNFIYDKVKI